MHGDIFSNSRLFKFRLRDSPACLNCNEPMDTIQHRLIECPKAREAWLKLNEAKLFLNLNPLVELSLENIMGAKDLRNKIELSLQAELILRLSTKSEAYLPSQIVRSAVLLVGNNESLTIEMQERFKQFKTLR